MDYFCQARSAETTAKIPMTAKRNVIEYNNSILVRNQAPPMAMSRIPQTSVLKAPRSYFNGVFALIPERNTTQRPYKVKTKEKIAFQSGKNKTRLIATIIMKIPKESNPRGLCGNVHPPKLLHFVSAFGAELGCLKHWVSTFRAFRCACWRRRDFGSAF